MRTTQLQIARIKAVKQQRTANGTQYVAHVVTTEGEHASLQSPSMRTLRKRLFDRGATAEQLTAAGF